MLIFGNHLLNVTYELVDDIWTNFPLAQGVALGNEVSKSLGAKIIKRIRTQHP